MLHNESCAGRDRGSVLWGKKWEYERKIFRLICLRTCGVIVEQEEPVVEQSEERAHLL